MGNYILRRCLQLIPTLLIIYSLVFALAYLMPGNPIDGMLGEEINRLSPAQRQAILEELGLNKPFLEQYLDFLWRMIRFDFGRSYVHHDDVMNMIGYRFPRTLYLMAGGMLVALLIGIPTGILSAIKPYSWMDQLLTLFTVVNMSMPVFWLALIAQLLLTQSQTGISLFPVGGFGDGNPYYLILPSLVLGIHLSAIISRTLRSSMLEVATMDHLITARAKGLHNHTVLFRHQVRNALIPVLTIVSLQIASLMTGAIVTETVFNWPGLGRVLTAAILGRDTPVIMGIMLLGAMIFLVVNLITDLLYVVLDPRIQYQKT